MMMKTKEADASTVNGASTGFSWDINRCSAGAAATSVWWDINRCPLPNDVDVRRVSPFIKRALEKLGYTGALTTTAIGILTDVPHDFLTQVYSSGIAIHHIPLEEFKTQYGKFLGSISGLIFRVGSDSASRVRFHFPGPYLFWESLLASLRADAMGSEALEEDKCSETCETAFPCAQFIVVVQGFENFSTHLKSEEHRKNIFFPSEQGRYFDNDTKQLKARRRRRRRGYKS
ncbi:unnamed protein product [Arabidopsis thaliana]|uniref:NYN domain-containing protein n=1 Tax=Arabidopsis thaliana TaxID=3702 RepID=Q9FJS6_ARATH|nr:unnamed protein product [Arabidopsis thaliana]